MQEEPNKWYFYGKKKKNLPHLSQMIKVHWAILFWFLFCSAKDSISVYANQVLHHWATYPALDILLLSVKHNENMEACHYSLVTCFDRQYPFVENNIFLFITI